MQVYEEAPNDGSKAETLFAKFSSLDPKSASAFKALQQFAFDKESTTSASYFLAELQEMKSQLPIKQEQINVDKLKSDIEVSDHNLATLNGFTTFINQLPDSSKTGTKESLINDNMVAILKIVEEAKATISDILGYTKLVVALVKTQETLKTNGKTYSADELISAITGGNS